MTGVRNIAKVSTNVSELPMSRKTPLAIDNIKPKPTVISIKGINMKGTKIIVHTGTTRYQAKTAPINTILIRKLNIDSPKAASTNVSRAKFIFVIMSRAFTRDNVVLVSPVANSCHTDMPRST